MHCDDRASAGRSRAAIDSTVMFCESASTSANTGRPCRMTTQLAEAMNVRGVTITSSSRIRDPSHTAPIPTQPFHWPRQRHACSRPRRRILLRIADTRIPSNSSRCGAKHPLDGFQFVCCKMRPGRPLRGFQWAVVLRRLRGRRSDDGRMRLDMIDDGGLCADARPMLHDPAGKYRFPAPTKTSRPMRTPPQSTAFGAICE